MAILNPDGSTYKLTGGIATNDNTNSPDMDYINSLMAEQYRNFGVKCLYYPVLVQESNVDKVYLEDRTKLWGSPIEIFAFMEPTSQLTQTSFGIEGVMDTVVTLHYKSTLQALGGVPTIGSRLFVTFRNQNMQINNVLSGDSYFAWHLWEIKLLCSNFQQSKTDNSINPSVQQQPVSNYKIV